MLLAAYIYDVNNTAETVGFKFGGYGGHSAIFNVCCSATCAITIPFQSLSQWIFLAQHVSCMTSCVCGKTDVSFF